MERAILVGAPRRGSQDALHVEHHLDELAQLADTAGATVVGRLVQQVEAPNPKYYIGPGKVAELQALIAQTDATLVVFDEELTPAQGKSLERAIDRRIMDRSELILDIFASRAKTKEAKMQVELAQLEYLLPRLARMWVHLSRIRGGIGLRGPGETQLETDRRMIRRKIAVLRRKLERVAGHRRVLRSGRSPIPTATLVGYTNAGKSSLLKSLAGGQPFVENRLFATLDTLTRETVLDGRGRVRLIDTVGFIRKLPHHLVASFRATLEEAAQANLLLHVIDASHEEWEEQVEVVDRVLADLGVSGTPVIHVFNKMDRLADPASFRERVAHRFERVALVSALRDETAELEAALAAALHPHAAPPATHR